MTHAIFVGPTRTATTSLFRHFLGLPGVSCSINKETNYFLRSIWDSHFRPNYEEYRALFPDNGGTFLEASPMYFCGGRTVAEAVAHCIEDARIIVSYRDPVARFISLYHHIKLKRNAAHELSLEGYFNACKNSTLEDVTCLQDIDLLGLAEGNYASLLQEWLTVFPPESIHVVEFESLSSHPDEVIASICRFLDITLHPGQSISAYNETRFVRNQSLHNWAMGLNNLLEPLFNRSPSWLRQMIRDGYYQINERAMDDAAEQSVIHMISDYYAKDQSKVLDLLSHIQDGKWSRP